MRYLFLVLTFNVFISCTSEQNKAERIIGGWRLTENNDGKTNEHFELFIDKDLIYVFTEINPGITSFHHYEVKGDSLFMEIVDHEPWQPFKINLEKDLLVLKNKNSIIKYKRIIDASFQEKFIKGEIDERTFNKKFHENNDVNP